MRELILVPPLSLDDGIRNVCTVRNVCSIKLGPAQISSLLPGEKGKVRYGGVGEEGSLYGSGAYCRIRIIGVVGIKHPLGSWRGSFPYYGG